MNRFLGAALLVSLAWNFAWSQQPAIGLKIGEPVVVTSGETISQPRCAFGADMYFVVWQDGWGGVDATANIKGIRLKAGNLEPIDKEPIAICSAPDAQELPIVAYANGDFLVAWQDFRSGRDYDVRGVIIDGKSGQRRGNELEIAVGKSSQSRPAVTSDGRTFLVVWQESRGDLHGVRGRRFSSDGKPLDSQLHRYSDVGSNPAVAVSAGKLLVVWAKKERTNGKTAAALVEPATGETIKDLGIINTCCGDSPQIAHDGHDGFVTVAGRASVPDPWGWGGPGAVVLARVLSGGETPESKLEYAYRFSNLCSRSVPNVVDAAVWKGAKTWNAGAVGGFQGTEDGLWPTGWPAVAHDGKATYLFAWVKGTIGKDRLNLSNFDIWVRGMDVKSLDVRVADRKAAATDADETRPVLINGPAGEILLLYERLPSGAPRIIEARHLTTFN